MFVDIENKISIYVITNTENGKKYVGITKDLNARWKDHKRNREASALQRAVKKYGIDVFDFTHIANAFSWEMACDLEKMLIKEYNSRAPNGYNLTDGGDGGNGYKFGEEEIKARSKRMKTDKNPMLGKMGTLNHFYGKNHNEQAKNKMALAWIKRKSDPNYVDPRCGKKRKRMTDGY